MFQLYVALETVVRLPTRNFDLNEDVSVKLSLPERFFVMMEEPTSSFAGVVVSSLAWNCSIGCPNMSWNIEHSVVSWDVICL